MTDLFAVANDGAAIRKGLVHEAIAKNKRSRGHCHENGLKHSVFPRLNRHVNVAIISLNARNAKAVQLRCAVWDQTSTHHGRTPSAALEPAISRGLAAWCDPAPRAIGGVVAQEDAAVIE